MIRVEVADMSNIERMLAGFSQSAVEKAIRTGITRTLKGAKQQAAKKATERYTAKASSISKTMKTRVSGITGELLSRAKRIPLTSFKHKPSKRPKKVTKGNPYLYSEVIRGQSRVREHAFLAPSNGIKAFERAGKSRYPIKMLYGPSAAEMLGKPPTSTFIMAKMQERLQIDVMHEVNALLGGFRS